MSKSVKVNFIYGDQKSISNNDAYSVVETIDGKENNLIDIIPLYEIPGRTSQDLLAAFSEAQVELKTGSNKEVAKYARSLLTQSATPA